MIGLHTDTSTTRLPIQISNSIIMNITYSMKQTKAIKTLLYNQDLDNENIQLVKHRLRKTDISDMTLEEAQRIIDKMSQAKKEAVNEILLGKVKPLIPERYYMEKNAERLSKNAWFNILMVIFIIGFAAFGIALTCVALTEIWGFICGILTFLC